MLLTPGALAQKVNQAGDLCDFGRTANFNSKVLTKDARHNCSTRSLQTCHRGIFGRQPRKQTKLQSIASVRFSIVGTTRWLEIVRPFGRLDTQGVPIDVGSPRKMDTLQLEVLRCNSNDKSAAADLSRSGTRIHKGM